MIDIQNFSATMVSNLVRQSWGIRYRKMRKTPGRRFLVKNLMTLYFLILPQQPNTNLKRQMREYGIKG